MAFDAAPPSATFADPIAPLILETGFVSSYAAPEPYRFTPAQTAAIELASGGVAVARPLQPPQTVQLGTFSDPANAERVAESFAGLGETIVAVDTQNGRSLRIVRVRTIDAGSVLAHAGKLGLAGAYVVSGN
ncbi:MAG TPA: SPOR domain-containing protein [Bauldia sp.]|nr:SPOR domain-containing protein [Bauldia sp.]